MPNFNTHKPTGMWQCTKLCNDTHMVAIHRTTDGQHSIELDTESSSQSYPISEELFKLILKELA